MYIYIYIYVYIYIYIYISLPSPQKQPKAAIYVRKGQTTAKETTVPGMRMPLEFREAASSPHPPQSATPCTFLGPAFNYSSDSDWYKSFG